MKKNKKNYYNLTKIITLVGYIAILFHGIAWFVFILFLISPEDDPGDLLRGYWHLASTQTYAFSISVVWAAVIVVAQLIIPAKIWEKKWSPFSWFY